MYQNDYLEEPNWNMSIEVILMDVDCLLFSQDY